MTNRLLWVKLVEIETGRILHGAGMEPGDLVVRLVGGDVSAGGEFILDDPDPVGGDPVLGQPFEVPVIIAADRGGD